MNGSLVVKGLNLSFGGQKVLKDVSLEAPSGKLLGLIGPNGAGKTSLLNCISGIYTASSGQVEIDAVSVLAVPPTRRTRLGLGRTFQHTQLLDDATALDNVMVGCHKHLHGGLLASALGLSFRAERRARERSHQALADCGVADVASSRVKDLSYGHRKLIDLARAAVGEPRYLLLDEPMAGLSGNEREAMAIVVEGYRESGMTIVMIEHDVSIVHRLADSLVVLDHGRVLAAGIPDQVLAQPEVVDSYLGA